MGTRNVAIRLGVEGGAEVKRVLDDAGNAGQQAFQKVGVAADAAGAATDRQTARWERLAKAARDAETASRSQSNVNALFGIGQGPARSARDSATVFELQARAAEEAQRQNAALAREVAALQARFDPLAAAAQRYQAALADITRAEQTGAISASAALNARIQETRAYEDATSKIERLGAAQKAAAQSAVNRQTIVPDRGGDIAAYGGELDRLRAKYNPLFAAQRTYLDQLAEIRQSVRVGALAQGEGAAAIQRTKDAFARQVVDIRARGGAGLTGSQAQNLIYQGSDIVSSLGSGSSLSMVALQQGPQIAQVFSGPGSASVKGAISQASEAATGFVSRLGLVGGVVGGVTTVVALGAAAFASYASRQREAELALQGIGRASGVTLAQINAVADANARAGRISVGTAREFGTTYAGTGRIDGSVAGSLIATTREFAKVTGQDAADAAKELAGAFADPAKGADLLNSRLGFLSDGVRENIRRLTEQGDRLGAQRVLLSAFKDSVEDVGRATSGWSALTAVAGELIGNTWDKIGRNISKGIFGGTIDQELVKANERLSRAQVAAEGGFGLFSSKDVETAQQDVDRLKRLIDDRNAKIEQAQRAQRSLEIGGVIRSLLPEQQELERLTNQVELVRKAISDPLKFGLDAQALAQAEAAFGRISRLTQTMSDDVTRFGTTAVAALNRTADFGARTVGYTPYGRSAAEINERFAKDLRDKGLDANGRTPAQVEADYRSRLGDTSIDLPERYNLAQRREEELRSARELDGYRRARDTELDTLRRTETLSLTPQGGAFSRMSDDVQRQIMEAARTAGPQISAGIIAAIAKGESSGNLGVGYSRALGEDGRTSSAYGLGQITRGTAEDAIRRGFLPQGYDRTDQATMAQGIAGVLQMKLQDVGGDLTKALEAYRGSNDPAVNRAYAAAAMRSAGQMGDASSTGLVRDQDALNRAQRDAGQQLEGLSKYYGVNGAALEALQQRQQKYNDLLDRGVSASDAASIAFGGLIDKTVDLARQSRLVQFARDDEFARDQLGRSSADQQAYSRARSLVGDTSSPAAMAVIERSRTTSELSEAKSMVTDGVTSFATALRRGGDAATALSDAFGNAADRMLSKALDSVVSQGFGMLTSGSGGIGSLASFLGFASGGWTGPAAAHVPVGVVHGNEYVFDAMSTSRIGVSTLEAIRSGVRGYDKGGYVSPFTMPSRTALGAAAANGNYSVVINEAPGGDRAETRMERGPNGDPRLVVDLISRQQAGEMASGRGPFAAAVPGARRLRG